MTPIGQLPQWVNMGDDEDYATPTGSLVDLLKKRMGSGAQGGAGAMAGQQIGNDMVTGKAMKPEGMESL